MESRHTMATPRTSFPRPKFLRRPRNAARRGVLALAGVMGGSAGISLVPQPASAAPDRPSTSQEAAALMAARAHDLEIVTERFNEARDELATQQATARAAAATLAQAQADLGAAQGQVRGIARSAFTGERLNGFSALMTSDDADDFVGRMSTLQMVAGHQNVILGQAAAAGQAAASAQADAAKAAADAQATFDTVSAQQADLQAQVNAYQADFNRLTAQERRAAAELAAHAAERASRDDRTGPSSAGSSSAGSSSAGSPSAGSSSSGSSSSGSPSAGSSSGSSSSGPVVAGSGAAQTAVNTAMAQRGKPYVWAAAGPNSFDCSGLVQYAYKAAGVSLPHSSGQQARMGRAVSRAELQPGDLVAFYSPVSHIGIYIGNGQMVHAPTSGDVVKVASIDAVGTITAMRRLVG